jgi:hypothetical protein
VPKCSMWVGPTTTAVEMTRPSAGGEPAHAKGAERQNFGLRKQNDLFEPAYPPRRMEHGSFGRSLRSRMRRSGRKSSTWSKRPQKPVWLAQRTRRSARSSRAPDRARRSRSTRDVAGLIPFGSAIRGRLSSARMGGPDACRRAATRLRERQRRTER